MQQNSPQEGWPAFPRIVEACPDSDYGGDGRLDE
jgi:hypothetical protein